MIYFITMLICSLWLLYSHFAWYVNGNLPYFGSIFSKEKVFLQALKLFSLQWSLVTSIIGLVFCFYLFTQLIHNKKNVESKLNDGIVWKFIVLFYVILTVFTLF